MKRNYFPELHFLTPVSTDTVDSKSQIPVAWNPSSMYYLNTKEPFITVMDKFNYLFNSVS
jgi:hypothetical protein